MLPPGNSSGCTVNPSVVTTSSWSGGTGSATASVSVSSCGFASAGANSPSISSRIRRPPLPCARLTCVSRNLRAGIGSALWVHGLQGGSLDQLSVADRGIVDRKPRREHDLEAGGPEQRVRLLG